MRPEAIAQTTTGTSRMRANVMRFGILKLCRPRLAPAPLGFPRLGARAIAA